MTRLSEMLQWYAIIFGAIIAIAMARAAWDGTQEFFQDGRFRRLLERLLSGDVFLDFLSDLGDFAFNLLLSLPYICLFLAGAFVLEEFLKTRVGLWGVMTAVAVWTSLWTYMVQAHFFAKSADRICELVINPNVYNLFHHEGYKRYYEPNKKKIDRLWGFDEPLAKGDDPAEDGAYQEQHKLGLWNERIRFLILGRLVWADFFGKTFLDELSFGKQMFGDPFPEPGAESEPYLAMETKNGLLRFHFDYPRKHYDGSDECLIAEFPLRLFAELPRQLMNFRGKERRVTEEEYMTMRRGTGRRGSKLRDALLHKYNFAPTQKWKADWYTDYDGDTVGCPTDDGFALYENEYFLIKFKVSS